MDVSACRAILASVRAGFVELADKEPHLLLEYNIDGSGQHVFGIRGIASARVEPRFESLCGRLGQAIRRMRLPDTPERALSAPTDHEVVYVMLFERFRDAIISTRQDPDFPILGRGTNDDYCLNSVEHLVVALIDEVFGRLDLIEPASSELLSVREAAETVNVSERTIQRWIQSKKLTAAGTGQAAGLSADEVALVAQQHVKRRTRVRKKKASAVVPGDIARQSAPVSRPKAT